MQDALIFHLTKFMSTHYRVKHRSSRLHRGYLYQIVHFCTINLTESATWFNNFLILNISR